jgi:2-oxoglutaroyl-CoA hydrolase
MTEPVMPDPLDGFHVEIDTKRERADVILDRPPLNVIAMGQREQLRAASRRRPTAARLPRRVLASEARRFALPGDFVADCSPVRV